jgi:predicted nucleotidyltransferase
MRADTSKLELLPEITQRILAVSDPEKIILFGSYARGDYGFDSDLDLLVVIKTVQSTREESTRLRRALRGLLVPIDVLVATPEQLERHRNTVGLIYRTVLSEGKILYERPTAA